MSTTPRISAEAERDEHTSSVSLTDNNMPGLPSPGNHSAAARLSSDTTNARPSIHATVESTPAPSTPCHIQPSAPTPATIAKPRRLYGKLETFCHRWWYWEIACALLGTCCMLAVIAILCAVNNTALSAWKFPIQPNSLVFVFMTVLALGLEPLTQQIIAFPTRQVVQKSGFASQAAVRDLQFVDEVAMNGAVLEGIYFSNSAPSVFDCTTSTCTWPEPFVSLGVCSACRDVSSILNVSCNTRPGPLVPAGEEPWSFDTTTCTYSLNNTFAFDTYIQSLHLPSSAGRPSEEAREWTQVKMTSPDVADGLGNFVKRNRTYLATVLAYATLFDEKTKGLPAITPSLLDPEVVACTLYWCAQVYANASVLNGTTPRPTAPSAVHDLRIPEEDRQSFPANDTFAVSQTAHLKLSRFFYQLFNITANNGNEAFAVFPERERGLYGISDVIYRHGDVARTFDNIAAAMTERGAHGQLEPPHRRPRVGRRDVRARRVGVAGVPAGRADGVGGISGGPPSTRRVAVMVLVVSGAGPARGCGSRRAWRCFSTTWPGSATTRWRWGNAGEMGGVARGMRAQQLVSGGEDGGGGGRLEFRKAG